MKGCPQTEVTQKPEGRQIYSIHWGNNLLQALTQPCFECHGEVDRDTQVGYWGAFSKMFENGFEWKVIRLKFCCDNSGVNVIVLDPHLRKAGIVKLFASIYSL